MVRQGDDPQFLCRDLVNDAIWKPAEQITAPGATQDRANRRVREHQTRRPLDLRKKCKPELGIRFGRVELRGLLNFGAGKSADDEIHRNVARI